MIINNNGEKKNDKNETRSDPCGFRPDRGNNDGEHTSVYMWFIIIIIITIIS